MCERWQCWCASMRVFMHRQTREAVVRTHPHAHEHSSVRVLQHCVSVRIRHTYASCQLIPVCACVQADTSAHTHTQLAHTSVSLSSASRLAQTHTPICHTGACSMLTTIHLTCAPPSCLHTDLSHHVSALLLTPHRQQPSTQSWAFGWPRLRLLSALSPAY